jgi:hypothetical protein
MSWSVTKNNIPPGELPGALDAALQEAKEQWPEGYPDHVVEQVQVAQQVAISIADSGFVGREVELNVTIGGHSNPEHKPQAGYSNDFITVTVTQV